METTGTMITTNATSSRRSLLRSLAAGAVTVAAVTNHAIGAPASAEDGSTERPITRGVRAYKLFAGADNSSHVLKGTVNQKDRTDVAAIYFRETPARSSMDWHKDPEPQFVITLSGTLEFTTRNGETFVLRPGDVLLAEDDTGSGHKWRLIDDYSWKRAYVVLKPGAKDSFVADTEALAALTPKESSLNFVRPDHG